MANQQLLDYIKQQLQQGVSQDQIKNSLMSNGWQSQDIEDGFNIIGPSVPVGQNPIGLIRPAMATWKIIIASLSGVVVVGGGIYFASQKFLKPKETPKVSNEVSNQLPTSKPNETVIPAKPPAGQSQSQNPEVVFNEVSNQLPTSKPNETVIPAKPPAGQSQSQNPEVVFADKLSSCTAYKITFKHLLTGDMLEKEILGIVNDKCDYVEQMPNGGKMECKYAESERKAVAQYYKDVASAESVGTSVKANLGSGEQKTTYTINGKVVGNPLQEAMNSGVCVISGY